MKRLLTALFGNSKRPRYSPRKPLLTDYKIDVGLATDVGCVRSSNQDHIACLSYGGSNTVAAIVADGMGGHNGGEVASQTAVEVFTRYFAEEPQESACNKALTSSFIEANAEILKLSQSNAALEGMGTTMVAVVLVQGHAYFANVGDSRLYLFRGGSCIQLSEDHTMVAEMLKSNLITPAEAENHPDKNIITRAVGTKPDVNLMLSDQSIALSDAFLLCSDGLYDLINNDELTEIVKNNSSQSACDSLINLAIERGGHDNISVIILKIAGIAEQPTPAPITRV